MAVFHNSGYRGLYNGETADDMLRENTCNIVKIFWIIEEDELVANLF